MIGLSVPVFIMSRSKWSTMKEKVLKKPKNKHNFEDSPYSMEEQVRSFYTMYHSALK